ncbi:unnamed protein product, partial [Mesorhabditis spiculigera]
MSGRARKREIDEASGLSESTSAALLPVQPVVSKKLKVENQISTSATSALRHGHIYYTKVHSALDCFNENCFSLADLLASIRPTSSLHFNFMIDLDWVLRQYPAELRTTPISLVVGEKMGTSKTDIERTSKALGSTNVEVFTAKLPIPYGTHHTKLSLFESADRRLHIVVSTANLVEGDWREKTQAFYYCTGELQSTASTSHTVFQTELLDYLARYKLPSVDAWIEKLKSTTLVENGDHFIYSVPGYHKADDQEKIAQLALRKALKTRKPDPGALYIAQCSSIGSLGSKPDQWMLSQFLITLRGGRSTGSTRLFLVYPTVKNVQESYEGWSAGGSLPYQSGTHQKQPWLRTALCKWFSENRGRSQAMPHVKTYCEIGEDRELKWMVLTSANLSKAAWGEIQKGGQQLCVRSYEAGVLIQDKSRCELPYDYPICRYKLEDEPWTVDTTQLEADSHGRQWIMD